MSNQIVIGITLAMHGDNPYAVSGDGTGHQGKDWYGMYFHFKTDEGVRETSWVDILLHLCVDLTTPTGIGESFDMCAGVHQLPNKTSQATVDCSAQMIQFYRAQCLELGVAYEFFWENADRCTMAGKDDENGGYQAEMGDHAADASRYKQSVLRLHCVFQRSYVWRHLVNSCSARKKLIQAAKTDEIIRSLGRQAIADLQEDELLALVEAVKEGGEDASDADTRDRLEYYMGQEQWDVLPDDIKVHIDGMETIPFCLTRLLVFLKLTT